MTTFVRPIIRVITTKVDHMTNSMIPLSPQGVRGPHGIEILGGAAERHRQSLRSTPTALFAPFVDGPPWARQMAEANRLSEFFAVLHGAASLRGTLPSYM